MKWKRRVLGPGLRTVLIWLARRGNRWNLTPEVSDEKLQPSETLRCATQLRDTSDAVPYNESHERASTGW